MDVNILSPLFIFFLGILLCDSSYVHPQKPVITENGEGNSNCILTLANEKKKPSQDEILR